MIDITVLQKRTSEAVYKEIGDFRAETAVVLGSGLSSLTGELENKKLFSYDKIPGLRKTSVEGHDGNFVYGDLNGVKVLFLQGRPHWYEGASSESFHVFIQAIQSFGCKKILMTNAAGAIDTSIPVGSIVAITDHINLHFNNPLMGINSTNSRFVGLENAYDSVFRDNIESIATENNIKLYKGVYVSTLGPCFETPAEIKAFRVLGGQVIGMSTVPEVITARFYGLKVAVLSLISNLAAGCGDDSLSHELTLSRVKMASGNMRSLLHHYISSGMLPVVSD